MFEYNQFKKILDETTELMEKIKISEKDEIEELQMKIESNIQALKIIANKIEDPESRGQFLKSIKSLCTNIVIEEKENIRKRKEKAENNNEVIDEELMKNATKLKDMVTNFSNSLKEDKKVVEKLSHKMNKNSEENVRNMKTLEKQGSSISAVYVMGIVLIIFIVTYFIIRFL